MALFIFAVFATVAAEGFSMRDLGQHQEEEVQLETQTVETHHAAHIDTGAEDVHKESMKEDDDDDEEASLAETDATEEEQAEDQDGAREEKDEEQEVHEAEVKTSTTEEKPVPAPVKFTNGMRDFGAHPDDWTHAKGPLEQFFHPVLEALGLAEEQAKEADDLEQAAKEQVKFTNGMRDFGAHPDDWTHAKGPLEQFFHPLLERLGLAEIHTAEVKA